MSTSNDDFVDTRDNNADVVYKFSKHCNGVRVETDLKLFDLIRSTYPNHHVTNVSQTYVSLFEFAKAGKASLAYDTEESSFTAQRIWRPVGEGVEKKLHPGKLDDRFRFVRFQYTWENKTFLVYHAMWTDPFKAPEVKFYILYPRGPDNVNDGHCAETDALCLAAGKWTMQLHKEIWVFDDGQWSKSKDLWRAVNGSSWDDVVLDPTMKKNLIEDVQGFFDNRDIYRSFSVPWKRGVILHGFPGNGKTVSIKALMSALYNRPDNVESLYVKSLKTKCQTQHYSVRMIFEKARRAAPCLLVFEDLDSLVTEEIRSYFLNEVDGLESNDGILMIGSTNHLEMLDPAIAKRPSRFDRKYHFKLPEGEQRRAYAEYWRSKLLQNDTVDFPEELCTIVGKLTEGFSFAYLKELFVMALLSMVRGFKEGDDFEIVDAAEAKKAAAAIAADVEASTCASGKKEDQQGKTEVCTCSKKCTSCNLPLESGRKKTEVQGNSGDKKENERTRKHSIPSVEIPNSLADNLLLKVLTHQIRTLHAEMDNTSD